VSAALNLARPEDLDRLAGLVAAFHAEADIALADDARRAALSPLLDGGPYGAAYLLGPVRAPVGYIIVCFSWSVEFGGLNAMVDEIYLRPAVRGRGIATEALISLGKALGQAGIAALHLEVDRDNPAAQRLYARAGFGARESYMLMSRRL
jgi:ribosomal protein S18 acetylase RimI-like enzyme